MWWLLETKLQITTSNIRQVSSCLGAKGVNALSDCLNLFSPFGLLEYLWPGAPIGRVHQSLRRDNRNRREFAKALRIELFMTTNWSSLSNSPLRKVSTSQRNFANSTKFWQKIGSSATAPFAVRVCEGCSWKVRMLDFNYLDLRIANPCHPPFKVYPEFSSTVESNILEFISVRQTPTSVLWWMVVAGERRNTSL